MIIEGNEGNEGNDTIIGSSVGKEFIDAGNGDDSIFVSVLNWGRRVDIDGGEGSDTIDFSMRPAGAAGAYANLRTGAVAEVDNHSSASISIRNVDNVTGSNAADDLIGSTAANRLAGGMGNDTLQGGGGNDTLAGGEGDDVIF